MTSALTQKGQITIPAFIRKILDLKPFDKFVFSVELGKVVAKPIKGDMMDLYGSIKSDKKMDFKKIRSLAIKRHSQHVAQEGLY